jgi:hypothetical protein
VFRKSLVLLVTAFLLCCGGVALAAGNGNPCDNGHAGQHNPNCTYPAKSSTVVRDANGNIVDGTHGLHVGDPMHIESDGWLAGTPVAFDFFSTVIHLGDVNADSAGVVRATFLVPRVEPGMHTLRLSGLGADGQPRVVDYPILVLADSQVLGQSVNNTTGGARSVGGSSVFGKTGLAHALDIAGVGVALLAVGLVLTLAVRRARSSNTLA